MSVRAEIAKTVVDTRRVVGEAKPLLAVAGAGDLGLARLRQLGARLQSARIEPADLQRRLNESVDGLQGGVLAAQHTVRAQLVALPSAALGAAARLAGTYDDLATRGEKTVGRIRGQQATRDLTDQAKTTVSKAKATRTTARKSVKSTTTQAKGATTSARKTAAAGRKAATAAADKVG